MGNTTFVSAEGDKTSIRARGARHYKRSLISVRQVLPEAEPLKEPSGKLPSIIMSVRKRPLMAHEARKNLFDVVSTRHPQVVVHDCGCDVVGDKKHIRNAIFRFDNVFEDDHPNSVVFRFAVHPMLKQCLYTGRPATLYLYGGPRSGRSYTLNGMQGLVGNALFRAFTIQKLHRKHRMFLSAFDVGSGNMVHDLLDRRRPVSVKDSTDALPPVGVGEVEVTGGEDLISKLKAAASVHETGGSASHALYVITVRRKRGGCLPCFGGGGSASSAVSPTSSRHPGAVSDVYTRFAIVALHHSSTIPEPSVYTPVSTPHSTRSGRSLGGGRSSPKPALNVPPTVVLGPAPGSTAAANGAAAGSGSGTGGGPEPSTVPTPSGRDATLGLTELVDRLSMRVRNESLAAAQAVSGGGPVVPSKAASTTGKDSPRTEGCGAGGGHGAGADASSTTTAEGKTDPPTGTSRAGHSPLTKLLSQDFEWDGSGSMVSLLLTVSPVPPSTEHSLLTLHTAALVRASSVVTKEEDILTTEVIPVSNFHSPSTRNIIVAEERKSEYASEAEDDKPRGPPDWDESEVAEWLKELYPAVPGLKAHAHRFNGMTGRELTTLPQAGFVKKCQGDEGLGSAVYSALKAVQKEATKVARSGSFLGSGRGSLRTQSAVLPMSSSRSSLPRSSNSVAPSPTAKRAANRPPGITIAVDSSSSSDDDY